MRNKANHASPLRWMLRRYFFLAVVFFLITFAVFPMQGAMRVVSNAQYLNQLDHPPAPYEVQYYIQQLTLSYVYSPLDLEILCLLFAGIGFAAAMVLFRHLFSRKQGMLIAGLPMTRTRGFSLRAAVFVIWCLLPMALCLGIYPLIVRTQGMWGYFDLGLYLGRAGFTLLLAIYGYALGALCASLFGTIWSACLAAMALGGSVEVTLYCWIQIAEWYLGTLDKVHANRAMLRCSPVYSLYKGFYAPGEISLLPALLAIALFLVLGFLAYRRVQPENAGHTLNMKRLEPAVLIWSIILGGTAGAMVLSLYLNREFILYLGLLLGAIVMWILTRMLLDQRIQISLRKWKLPAAVALGLCLICLGLRMDWLGFCTWQPRVENLSAVRISRGRNDETQMNFEDPEGIEASLAWASQAQQEYLEDRAKNPFTGSDNNYQIEFEDRSGKITYRTCQGPTDKAAVLPALRVMAESYEKQLSESISSLPNVQIYSRLNSFGISSSDFSDTFGFSVYDDSFPRLSAEEVRAALKQDLAARTLDSLQEPPLLSLSFQGIDPESGSFDYSYLSYAITASDTNTLGLILGDDAEKWIDFANGGFARSDNLLIFQCEFEEDEAAQELRLKSYRRAESEEEVRAWMAQTSRGLDSRFTLPTDLCRRVVIYSLDDLRDQMEYNDWEADLEDPEVLAKLPEIKDAWGQTYYFIAGME